ncbi:MAG: class I SAM-dependent methyltransferase [Gammaproteobacteria bacterium]|nr:class I SAM-dependent methyltransferase [Gammaproteobacteria bacterium]
MNDRKQHWDQVYGSKSPLEVSWFQQEPAVSLRLIQNSTSDRTQPILDVGGGASVLVDRLLERDYSHLSVLDISANALDQTKQRLGPRADQIEWHVSDVTKFNPPHRYACWHDRAVFHFLTDAADRARYVEALDAALEPGGHLVLAAFALGGPTMCSGLDIVQYNAEKLSRELGNRFMLLEEVDELHITPAQKEQLFCYYRFLYN